MKIGGKKEEGRNQIKKRGKKKQAHLSPSIPFSTRRPNATSFLLPLYGRTSVLSTYLLSDGIGSAPPKAL
jgi:hypothetical protein